MADDHHDDDTFTHTREVMEGRAPLDPEKMRQELARLERDHGERLRRFCFQYTRNRETAEELAQEALLVAWRKLPEFRRDSSLSTWIFGIARGLAWNKVRRVEDRLFEDGLADDVDPGQDVLRSLSSAERKHVMRSAAAAVLDAHEQEVVFLRYVENLGRPEIAEELELAGGADEVRTILQRCTRKLKPELTRRIQELGRGVSFVRSTDS
ncbi:MAG: RNA polymerase sigma factor [Alphaproteobacteria bacterium]|nr:RNA polymerase sigma factor [Alphaproteobacteria bacterium]